MLPTDTAIQIAQDAGRLTVEIANTRPLELLDLTNSLLSVGDEYRRFTTSRGLAGAEDARFYVQQIRTGSIIADLVPILAATLPLLEHVNNVVQFAEYLKAAYNVLLRRPDAQSPQIEKRSLQNLSQIVEPVAKDPGAQIHITATNSTLIMPVQMSLNSIEANAAQNTVQRLIQGMRESATGLHHNVVLYWYQARGTPASSPIDKGIIESISPNPIKVLFSNDAIKTALLLDDENPFRMAYLVDVAVETVNGRPILYKVLAVHEKLERPSTTDQPDLFDQLS